MEAKIIQCENLGMTQDTAISALAKGQDGVSNYAFENHNIRILAVNNNTKFAVTNEKSTKKEEVELIGTFLGSCKLNNYIVVFTKLKLNSVDDVDNEIILTSSRTLPLETLSTDYIYRLEISEGVVTSTVLYSGNLGFSLDNPIEAIGYYESEEVQKVYWVDGLNQNRFINISPTVDTNRVVNGNDYQFDFQGQIGQIPTVTITKDYDKAGSFLAGILQYFITYYNKFGIETCIVWNSALQYLSLPKRGAKPDENVSCGFILDISNVNTNYDYLRVYSVYRSGNNSISEANIVAEVSLKETSGSIIVTDLGTQHIAVNSQDMPYIGGQTIKASTLDYKQDTLFLGDIKLEKTPFPEIGSFNMENTTITDLGATIKESKAISWVYKKVSDLSTNGVYDYTQEISQSQKEIAGFKWRELYRFGIQFMSPTGEWTSAHWIGDKYCDYEPRVITQDNLVKRDSDGNVIKDTEGKTSIIDPDAYGITTCPHYNGGNRTLYIKYTNDGHYIAEAHLNLGNLLSTTDLATIKKTYKAYRLLVANMDNTTRRIISQGVICPTMFNYNDRKNNRPYSIPSWMFRPRTELGATNAPINRHYDTLPVQDKPNAELQGIMERLVPGFDVSAHNPEGTYNAFNLVIAANDGGSYVQWKLIYYNSGGSEKQKADNIAKIAANCGKSVTDSNFNKAVYSGNYKVVSSGQIKKVIGKWDKVYAEMVNTITQNTIDNIGADEVLLSAAMLPDGNLLKKIAYQKGDNTDVAIILAAVLGSLAGIVATIFTAGAAAAAVSAALAVAAASAAQTATAVALSITSTVLATMAVSGIAGTGAIADNIDKFQNTDRKMAKLNFMPISYNKEDIHGLSNREKTAAAINRMYYEFFSTKGNIVESKDLMVYLDNDPSVPFTCHSSAGTSLGMDYNAYCLSGTLTNLTEEERDTNKKKNLFCVDESIVTMNTPFCEDIFSNIADSEAYRLDLVGVVPVQAVHGEYQMECAEGLNTNSQVIPNRFVEHSLYTNDILGLVNGDFYQDAAISETAIKAAFTFDKDGKVVETTLPEMQVSAGVALYRQWMWGRDASAGLWLPGLPLINAIGDGLTSSTARMRRKLFANLRFSPNTEYHEPYTMDIESPVVCLDSDEILKSFNFNGEKKFYYEAVNTLSMYEDPYNLIVDGNNYLADTKAVIGSGSSTAEVNLLERANLHDPIQIKYKQTPHIVIPFKTTDEGIYNILPYTKNESLLLPELLYKNSLGNIVLDGIKHIPYTSLSILSYVKLPYIQRTDGLVWSKHNSELNTVDKIKFMQYISSASRNMLNSILTNCGKSTTFTNDSEFTDAINYALDQYEHMAYDANWYDEFDLTMSAFDSKGNVVYRNYLLCCNGIYYKIYSEVSDTDNIRRWYSIRLTNISTGKTIFPNSYRCVLYNRPYLETKLELEFKTVDTTKKIIIHNSTILMRFKDEVIESNRAVIPNDTVEGISCLILYFRSSTDYDVIEDHLDKVVLNSWNQYHLDWEIDSIPYLFIGELVKKSFNYSSWLGGTQEYGLEQLTWNVASEPTMLGNNNVDSSLRNSWGDTFYQRWDCQKTYPYTEEDSNSVVDVLSFMVESHENLDGRCDVNRGLENLRNIRPTNTIYNKAYSQKDNFFSYQVLDEKFDKDKFDADIAWSLAKTNEDDIDKWTSITSVNEMSLDGRFGPIRKILNVNDTLIAFQDSALSAIKYNEQTALSTTSGLPLQLGNTTKVDGYRIITDTSGCRNKFSINKNSAGVFYIDDYNKSLNHFSANTGSTNVSLKAEFSLWFKKNIVGKSWSPNNSDAFRTSFDELTGDLYIINKDTCLIYNTMLGKFTSFMDYVNTPLICNLSEQGLSGSYAFRNIGNKVEIYKMFGGDDYGTIYGEYKPYSIEYRLNPDPTHDSIFTNYAYTADWSDETNTLKKVTFDTVEAKNEYQYGISSLTPEKFGRNAIKERFRVWRGYIPRDGSTELKDKLNADRMRNPWIHLKFTKKNADNSKMIFHNLTVMYYNQYGRY